MEFIEGETLSARIKRAGAIPPAEARDIARQVCAGLAQAHRQGVVHGDLKCGNIILAKLPDGGMRAVLTDFGLATSKLNGGAGSKMGPLRGSFDYIAPEMFSGSPASIASDLYALGVIFHIMLTGKAPPPLKELRTPQDSSAPPPMPKAISDLYVARRSEVLPGPWQGIVNRCLELSPKNRFSSAEDMRKHLDPTPSKWVIVAGVAGLLTMVLGLGLWYRIHFRSQAAIPIRSVAVVPFVNARGTPEYEYLSDGISEGLINALAQLPDLKVIARSSSFQFRGEHIDVRRVAQALGVRAIVTGRIADMGGRLRISAELVDGADGTEIWGAQYSRGIADLAGAQAEISRDIAERIRSELTLADRRKLEKWTKTGSEAYALLLRGRYQIRLYTPESRQKAVGYYEQALAVDPSFALANAELAAAYRLLSGSGILGPADAMPKAEAAARRALAIDEDLAEAHAALADIKKDQWDWPAAEREYRRALQLNPNLAIAHEGLAIGLSVSGKYDAAIAEAQRAAEVDPIGLPAAINGAAVYYNARRFDQALATLQRAKDLDPYAPTPWTWTGIVNGGSGQFAQALEAYQKAISLGDNTAATRCYYAYSLARSGHRDQALNILRGLQRSHEFVPATTLAILLAGLDQKERAIRVLQASYASRDPLLQYLTVESHYDVLKDDPRFRDLVAKIALPH